MIEHTYNIGLSTDIRTCYINKLYDALMYEETPYELFVRKGIRGKQFRRITIFCDADNEKYFARLLHRIEETQL